MIIIGEKLNGAIPAVAKAIAARDSEFIRQRALAQAKAAQDEDYFEEPAREAFDDMKLYEEDPMRYNGLSWKDFL